MQDRDQSMPERKDDDRPADDSVDLVNDFVSAFRKGSKRRRKLEAEETHGLVSGPSEDKPENDLSDEKNIKRAMNKCRSGAGQSWLRTGYSAAIGHPPQDPDDDDRAEQNAERHMSDDHLMARRAFEEIP